jgi:hypothetical protein
MPGESCGSLIAMSRVSRLRDTYDAFNGRDIDRLLEQMTKDVDWPNAWEGGRAMGQTDRRLPAIMIDRLPAEPGDMQGSLRNGARGTRTPDLLGAIWPLCAEIPR